MRLLISLIVLALCLTACGGNAAPEVGTAGIAAVWDEQCIEANDGQRLFLEGYFNYGYSFSESSDGTAYVEFRSDGHGLIPVYLSVGTNAGQVKAPPFSYGLEDIEVRTSAGEVLEYRDLARFHFTLQYNGLNAAGSPSCDYEAPYLIESLAAGDAEATEAGE